MKRNNSEAFKEYYKFFFKDLDRSLDEIEIKMEKELIELFKHIGIRSTVKADRYSLPYNKEYVAVLHSESWIPGMTEYNRIFRKIIYELLKNDARKIRFYVHIEAIGETVFPFFNKKEHFGLKYSFRYYLHD